MVCLLLMGWDTHGLTTLFFFQCDCVHLTTLSREQSDCMLHVLDLDNHMPRVAQKMLVYPSVVPAQLDIPMKLSNVGDILKTVCVTNIRVSCV